MRRGFAFGVLAVLVVVATVGYLIAISRGPGTPVTGDSSTRQAVPLPSDEGYVAFRRTVDDSEYGTVGWVHYERPDEAPMPTSLSCERVHMSATSGVCLFLKPAVTTTAEVLLLDGDMSVLHRLTTPGVPSRARVSPDGRWAATTTFVFGHSYADAELSTRTEIYDVADGKSLGDIETWDITYNGEDYSSADVNVWGITFASDGDSFFATIRTAGRIHLAQGSISARSLAMTDTAAECPSLSPSGELLAYKSATGPRTWQIRVLRLADGSDVALTESRSVNDQIEWWDEDTVVYGLDREGGEGGATSDVWAVAADGSGQPQLRILGAWSPAVVLQS